MWQPMAKAPRNGEQFLCLCVVPAQPARGCEEHQAIFVAEYDDPEDSLPVAYAPDGHLTRIRFPNGWQELPEE